MVYSRVFEIAVWGVDLFRISMLTTQIVFFSELSFRIPSGLLSLYRSRALDGSDLAYMIFRCLHVSRLGVALHSFTSADVPAFGWRIHILHRFSVLCHRSSSCVCERGGLGWVCAALWLLSFCRARFPCFRFWYGGGPLGRAGHRCGSIVAFVEAVLVLQVHSRCRVAMLSVSCGDVL